MPRKVDPSKIQSGSGTGSGKQCSTGVAGLPALLEHLFTDSNAHPATAITVSPPVVQSSNVQGALNELAALVPEGLPGLGEYSLKLQDLLIPDWGALKLRDSSAVDRGEIVSEFPAFEIFPYFYTPPLVARNPAGTQGPFNPTGDDPSSDPFFNIEDLTYTGGGEGKTHAGAFVRSGETVLGHRILENDVQSFVVSGVVAPADRGVLALIRWQPGETFGPISTPSDLEDRVVAAVLLGAGANSPNACDGASSGPGIDSGIFVYGEGNDPRSFPGKATGQFDLNELHTGMRYDSSGPLPSPFDSPDDSAGQVRIGTDPAAGPVLPDGLPILGGSTAARAGGDDNNFFAYRLPYLSDYSSQTGIRFTPDSERGRYFQPPPVSADPSSVMDRAGKYPDFDVSFWEFQVARYRHRVEIPGDDLGSFALIHFKTESAFEEFVRDAVPPSQDDVYSVLLEFPINAELAVNLASPGFQPTSGYHGFRGAVFRGLDASSEIVNTDNEFSYTVVPDRFMFVSGVRYFIPRDKTNNPLFELDRVFSEYASTDLGERFWERGFLTHDITRPPFGDARDGIPNRNPLVLGMEPFAGEDSLDLVPTATAFEEGSIPKRARIETNFTGLNPGSWANPTAPLETDPAVVDSSAEITLLGDRSFPRFSTDAKIKSIVRRPTSPGSDPDPFVWVTDIDSFDKKHVLFHSSGHGGSPIYGNFERTDVVVTNMFDGSRSGPLDGTEPTGFVFDVLEPGTPSSPQVFRIDVNLGFDPVSFPTTGTGAFFDVPGESETYRLWFNLDGGNTPPAAPPLTTLIEVPLGAPPNLGIEALFAIRFALGSLVDFSVPYPFRDLALPEPSLHTPAKDVEERFLDEVYRYQDIVVSPSGVGVPPPLSAEEEQIFQSSGLPSPSPVNVAVRPCDSDARWSGVSFFGRLSHVFFPVPISSQISGLPNRTPPPRDGSPNAQPSSGILVYPKTDYSIEFRPSDVDGDINTPGLPTQPDFSTTAEQATIFTRVFDAAFSRSFYEPVVGTSEMIIRLRGITLEDIAYKGLFDNGVPLPGGMGMAVLVKIPGLTTWLDAGREDGQGPSKQDPTEDFGGCLVLDAPETFDGIDDEGVVFTQLKLNFGPDAQFFLNSRGEAPVMVRVTHFGNLVGKSLDFSQGGSTESNRRVRGLIGISLIRQSEAFSGVSYFENRFDSGLEDTTPLDTGTVTAWGDDPVVGGGAILLP